VELGQRSTKGVNVKGPCAKVIGYFTSIHFGADVAGDCFDAGRLPV
jgi:hypothetical protein